ncbi:MAG TPA: HD domain-containing protein [Desulfatiglandales bacterium]
MEQVKQVDLIDRAIETAVKAHQKQKRKGTRIPYITHPFAVGIILAKAGCSEKVVVAGILHDTIEDARIKPSRIREEFGEKVAFIVEKCTEPDKRRSWRERKQHTLDSVKEAVLDVKFVVCADKLHNIRTIARDYRKVGDRVWKRFRRGQEDQQWYYTSLVESLRITEGNPSYEKLYKEFKGKVREVFGESRKGRIKHEQRN